MSTGWIIALSILGGLLVILVVLFFLGRKAQKKQESQQAQIEAMKQSYSMLIIDKKKLRLKDSGLPNSVIEQAPKLMKRAKLPIVKAKVGPQLVTLVCDGKIFEDLPVKKEVKGTISGIYLTAYKELHGKREVKPPKKKSRYAQFVEKIQEKGGAKPIPTKAKPDSAKTKPGSTKKKKH